MLLKNIVIKNFRNIKDINIIPSDSINVIYGDNAQGKTNLIEAIWLLSGNQSFRGNKLNEMITINEKFSVIEGFFEDRIRENKIKIILSDKKKAYLNGVEAASFNELNGNFYSVVFSPAHLSLIKDGPKIRRKFIDTALCQINYRYKNYLMTYERLCEQRNALLKNSSSYYNLKENMCIWNLQLAKAGAVVSIYRNDYVNRLKAESDMYYKGISSEKEKMNVVYKSTVFEDMDSIKEYNDEIINLYCQRLESCFEEDLRQGFTSIGPHRDDIFINVDDISVKAYGSQGQQRSCIIALKLAEAKLLKDIVKENPVMLLDDVLSELDLKRQDYILNNLSDMQVFITCCDINNTELLKKGKVFHIENGGLMEEKEYL